MRPEFRTVNSQCGIVDSLPMADFRMPKRHTGGALGVSSRYGSARRIESARRTPPTPMGGGVVSRQSAEGNPPAHTQGRMATRPPRDGTPAVQGRGYFFTDACLAAAACCCFAWVAVLALACFCEDFFWFALGDLSPMVVVGLLWLAEAAAGCVPCQLS